MSNQQTTISQEAHDMLSEAFKTMEIRLSTGDITKEILNEDKSYYLGMPVAPPSKEKIELLEIKQNKIEIEQFYDSLAVIPSAIETVKQALATIGLKTIPVNSGIDKVMVNISAQD